MDVSKPKPQITFSPPVSKQRWWKVLEIIVDERWRKQMKKLVDFGCSSFNFFTIIKRLSNLNEIFLVDINENVLTRNICSVLPHNSNKFLKRREEPLMVNIFTGSVIHPDKRLLGTDVVTAIELIEHLYPDELDAFPYNIFGFIVPKLVIVTTPNAEFNVVFGDDPKRLRNRDHKFEWTRSEFEDWARNITIRFPNYKVFFSGVGEGPEYTKCYGTSTQIALFIRKDLIGENYLEEDIMCRCYEFGSCRSVNPASRYLRCKCLCKVCCPNSSVGVCRYLSCSRYKNRNMFREFSGDNRQGYYYKCLRSILHPFDNDNRTEEEKILEELERQIIKIITSSSAYLNREKNRFEIPLFQLLIGEDEEDGNFISVSELKNLLEKYYLIENLYVHQTGKCHPHIIQPKGAALVKQLEPLVRKIRVVPG